jgi:dTDP-4-dehydrorhamnose 3,5-epimerase
MASLRLTHTVIKDCYSLETGLYEDMRGVFMETWNRRDFIDAGLPINWPQDNISTSHKNVLRGLHIQRSNCQGKLVRCVQGSIFDVCLDLRRDSPSFLCWHGEVLTGGKALYCPPGTAHAFLALEPESIVYYKCSTLYDKASDGGICPLDPLLKIEWPSSEDLIVSLKDQNLPTLEQWLADPRGIDYERRR